MDNAKPTRISTRRNSFSFEKKMEINRSYGRHAQNISNHRDAQKGEKKKSEKKRRNYNDVN